MNKNRVIVNIICTLFCIFMVYVFVIDLQDKYTEHSRLKAEKEKTKLKMNAVELIVYERNKRIYYGKKGNWHDLSDLFLNIGGLIASSVIIFTLIKGLKEEIQANADGEDAPKNKE